MQNQNQVSQDPRQQMPPVQVLMEHLRSYIYELSKQGYPQFAAQVRMDVEAARDQLAAQMTSLKAELQKLKAAAGDVKKKAADDPLD